MKIAIVLSFVIAAASSENLLYSRQGTAGLQGARAPDILTWSGLKSPAAWNEAYIDLAIPAVGDAPFRLLHVRSKHVLFRPTAAPLILSAVAVSDPNTSQTYILSGGRFYISDKDGMLGVSLAMGTLTFYRSYVNVMMPDAEVAVIEKFAAEFTPESVTERAERSSHVQLGTDAPPDFFVRGSQLVDAEISGYEVRDRILRLDLRSYQGVTGRFWVDLAQFKTTKSEFGRDSYRERED